MSHNNSSTHQGLTEEENAPCGPNRHRERIAEAGFSMW
jgi:hypothetical protein